MSATKRKPPQRSGGLPLFPMLLGAVVVIGIVAIVLVSAGGGDDDGGVPQNRPVTVEGDALPAPPEQLGGEDAAVGRTAPTLTGADFDGNEVTIGADGRPKVVFFVAHWCPHCQAEIPRLDDWLASHELPGDLDVYIVSTRVKEGGVTDRYPPSEWLAEEGVDDLPTIADSEESDAVRAFGAGGLPYIVYLDGDNVVQLRTTGEYPADPEAFTAPFTALAEGGTPVDPRLATG